MDRAYSDVRHELERQRDRVARRVGTVEADLRAVHDDDWVERAIEIENDAVLERLDASGRLELAAIQSALARLEDGTYGICTKCGEPIDERRLKAVPTATTCLTCAR